MLDDTTDNKYKIAELTLQEKIIDRIIELFKSIKNKLKIYSTPQKKDEYIDYLENYKSKNEE